MQALHPRGIRAPIDPRAILALCVTAACVAVLVSTSKASRFPDDSYFYLAKARSLARLGGLAPNFGGFDRKFFPGYSIVLAPFWMVFGERSYLVLGLLAFVMTVFVMLRLARAAGLSAEAAAWGGCLFCASPVVINWTAMPMSEPVVTLLIASFLLARIRAKETGSLRHALLAAALYGAAAITRAEAMLLGIWILADLRVATLRRWAVPVLLAAGVLPATYLALLLVHRNDGGAVTHYATEISDHRLPILAFPGRVLYHLGAAFDLAFEYVVAPIPRLAVGIVRVVVTIGTGIAVATAWRSQVSRALVPPILVGIAIHTAWFYQYQRFAFTWAPETALLVAWLVIDKSERLIPSTSRLRRAPIGATALLFLLFSIVAGFLSSRAHHEEWADGAPSPNVLVVADLVRRDSRCDGGVVASPEPELAYHLDRPVWFAGDKELFVRSDVRPNQLREFISRTGVHCVVTVDEPRAWLAQWGVPAEEATIEGPGRPWKVYVR